MGGGGEPVGGHADRLGQDLGQGQAAEAPVQGQPAVHGAGHGDGGDVAPQGDAVEALGSEAGGVGAGTGEPGRVQSSRGGPVGVMHQGPHVTAGAAGVGGGDGQHGVGAHGGVGGGPAPAQQVDADSGGGMVDGGDHPGGGGAGDGPQKLEHSSEPTRFF